MAAAAPPPADANIICALFQLHESIDKHAFKEIFNDLESGESSLPSRIPNNAIAIAVVLTSMVKVLACHGPCMPHKPSSSSSTKKGNVDHRRRRGFLYGLALNFVRYRSELKLEDLSISMALVQVLNHCSSLLSRARCTEHPSALAIMIRYFLECLSLNSGVEKHVNGSSTSSLGIEVDAVSFRTLLCHTLCYMRSNIVQCLEDFSDFQYIWSSTLNDGVVDTPAFSSESVPSVSHEPRSWDRHETDRHELKHQRKRMRSASIGNDDKQIPTTVLLRQVAKELAWTFLQSSYQSAPSSRQTKRDDRILNAAACIDLVVAASMAPIISAPNDKRRRIECGDISPRHSAGDESAAVLSNILPFQLNDEHDCSCPTEIRGQLKRSILQSTTELGLSLTDNSSPIRQKDIVERAQKIASSILQLLIKNYAPTNASPASRLLTFISSHELRKKSLHILDRKFQRAMAENIHASIVAYFPYSNHDLSTSTLGNICIDVTHDLFHLCLSERKLLAPFASSPYPHKTQIMGDVFDVRVLIFRNQTREARPPVRHVLQLSRVQTPITSETTLDELNKWTETLCESTSAIKPSPWLLDQLASASDFMYDGGDGQNVTIGVWKGIILPMLNYFMAILARDPNTSQVMSDSGEYIASNNDNTPGAALQLYYFALESIIRKSPSMIHNKPQFHSSLFSLCYFCLQTAVTLDAQRFEIEDFGDCPAAFYTLVEMFIEGLKSDGKSMKMKQALALPSYVTQGLRKLQEMILSMVWMKCNNNLNHRFESSFLGMVIQLRKNTVAWRLACPVDGEEQATKVNSREEHIVHFLLQNLVVGIKQRVSSLLCLLSLPSPSLAGKTLDIFKRVLRDRTELFFDRHPDQLMLCCLFVTVGNRFTFQKIADAYIEMNADNLGPEISHTIIHSIKNCSGHGNQCGDIISLYNDVFLPGTKGLWRHFRRN